MGGSGGGQPPRNPGTPKGPVSDPCDLFFTAELFGPVASVVQTLSKGDRLTVELLQQGDNMSVAALTKETRNVAGTITAVAELADLIGCLDDYSYEAEVIEILGSKVSVIVERV